MESALGSVRGVVGMVGLGRRSLSPEWWARTTLLVVTGFLVSCGGGSGGQATSPATAGPTTVTVTPSVDSSLQAPGALAIAKTMTTVETQPMGVSIAARGDPDSVVYAVDGAGDVALAANIANGHSTFSAEGTVLALGSAVLATISPNTTLDQLQTSLRNADGFAALVSDLASAVLAGKNPLDEPGIQQGFDRVLSSAASLTAQIQAGRVRPQAVAPSHADAAYEPSVLETSTFKVSIANQSSGVLKFDSKVYLRNTSALFFKAALLDLSGAQRTSAELEGAGASVFSLKGVFPLEITKSFAGPFSVRLLIDDERNAAELLKGALGFVKIFNSDCANKVYSVAAKNVVDAPFAAGPLDWLEKVLKDEEWKTAKECAGPYLASETVVAIVKGYSKITKVVGFARLVADRLLLPNTIPDTGVCLSETQYQMSCVASITATAINPMMPGAVQRIDIEFLDKYGKKTLAPPYGLAISYNTPETFKLSDTFTQVIAGPLEGAGDVTMIDPATEKKLSLRVTVTNGKLEQSAYSVPVNGTVSVKLIDPASGLDVYRNPATFTINLADNTYGSFITSDPHLGGIYFQAAGTATPTPQPIMQEAHDTGSTLSVDGVDTRYWYGTFTNGACQSPPGAMRWFWEVPCYNIGVIDGQYGATFWFPSAGGNLTMQSDGMVRKVFDVHWNATNMATLRLSMPTEVLVPSWQEARYVRYSGTRLLELNVDRRTATEIGGTYVVTSTSGAAVDITPNYPDNVAAPIETRGTGTWSARLMAGPMPITDMNGFDLCFLDNGASNYRNLDSVVFTPGNGSWYTSLGRGSTGGSCVYGQ